jgi:methyl-accepting chemotaxis protein
VEPDPPFQDSPLHQNSVKRHRISTVAATEQDHATQRDEARAMLQQAAADLLALGFGVFTARAITSALSGVSRSVERLANGDFTAATGVDDVGRMAAALDSARENLRGLVASVASSADAVAPDLLSWAGRSGREMVVGGSPTACRQFLVFIELFWRAIPTRHSQARRAARVALTSSLQHL